MAAVDRGASAAAPEPSPTNAARSVEASKLLDMFTAAKPMNPDAFVPDFGMPGGGDIQLQPGLYTYALIGPEVRPTESQSQLCELENELARLAEHHDSANETASGQVSGVFGGDWTVVTVRPPMKSTTRRSAPLTSSRTKKPRISAVARPSGWICPEHQAKDPRSPRRSAPQN